MKNKFIKLISSVLVLAFLLSSFVVFASANEGENTETKQPVDTSKLTVLVNRTFEEGWEFANGFSGTVGKNEFGVEYEETDDYTYNYYTRVEALSNETSYFTINYGDNTPERYSVFEFDIKTDDYTNFSDGPLFQMTANTQSLINLLYIKNNELIVQGAGALTPGDATKNLNYPAPSASLGNPKGEWIHLAFTFSTNELRCTQCGNTYHLDAGVTTDAKICEACNADYQARYDAYVLEHPNATEKEIEKGIGFAAPTVDDMEKYIALRLYFGYADSFNAENAIEYDSQYGLEKTMYWDISLEGLSTLKSFTFGLPGAKNIIGHSYLLDNIAVYNNVSEPIANEKLNGEVGLLVDTTQAKTVEIKSASGEKTAIQYLNEGLVMKVGSDYCLNAGVVELVEDGTEDGAYSGPAVKIDGTVYVPLQAVLNWLGYPMYTHEDGKSFDVSTENGSTFITIGRTVATANGQLIPLDAAPITVTEQTYGRKYICVAIGDVEKLFAGYYATYDDMGLIAISSGKNLFNRESDLGLMITIMKKFLFQSANGENYYYNTVKNNTNNFDHPYLVATEDDFTNLRNTYSSENGDKTLKKYLDSVVREAEIVYTNNAVEDPTVNNNKLINGENGEVYNPHLDEENAGYNARTGRLDAIAEYANEVLLLAFAYRVTGDVKYARLAYEYTLSLTKWEHWGPAYIVNTADATAAIAIAYDWLYDVWTGEDLQMDPWETEKTLVAAVGMDISLIEDAIYKHGVYSGIRSTQGLECLYPRNQADQDKYTTEKHSWNAICTSGMTIGALAILGNYAADSGEVENMEYLIKTNTENLINIGLEAYAPDGSYSESIYYWARSTNAIALMSWCFKTSTGSERGYMDTWGVDNSFYKAYQMEFSSVVNSDGYQYWSYNDAPIESLNTSFFFFAAESYNDNALAAIRTHQLRRKDVTIWDAIGYKPEYAELSISDVNVSLDATYDNIDGYVSRSDWEDGALFVGVSVDRNDTYHGQIDSGNFIYANKNYTWFLDHGTENPGVYGYLDSRYRYGYYKNTGEGANIVIVANEADVPYGQLLEAQGTVTEYVSEDAGMYVMIDNTAVYGKVVNQAYRGVLLTNDRKTVVIQDEIDFSDMRTCYWVGQTAAKIDILDDQRTAYLLQNIDGTQIKIRVSIVSSKDTLKFEKMSTYDFLLSGTYATKFSTALGGEAEDSRNGLYERLCIVDEAGRALNFKCAVVIEEVETVTNKEPVSYNYVNLNQWRGSTETLASNVIKSTYTEVEKNESVIGNVAYPDLINNAALTKNYIRNETAFSTKTKDFFRSLAYCATVAKVYEPYGAFDPANKTNFAGKTVYSAYTSYLEHKALYDYFKEGMNADVTVASDIAKSFTGRGY